MKKVYYLILLLTLFSHTSSFSQTSKEFTSIGGTRFSYEFFIQSGSQAVPVLIYSIGAGGGGASTNGTGGGSKAGGSGASGAYVRGTYSIPPQTRQYFRVTIGQGGVGRLANDQLEGGNGGATLIQTISGPNGTTTAQLNVSAGGGRGGNITSAAAANAAVSTTGLTSVLSNSGNPGNYSSNSNSGFNGADVNYETAAIISSSNPNRPIPGSAGESNSNGGNAQTGAGGGSSGRFQTVNVRSGNGGDGYVRIEFSAAGATLPVTFGAIRASEKGTGVQIDWTSYSESNIANYQIERSADGINFTSVGEVAPRNVAEATNYNFFDALPLSGTSFYRIRNNDIDGKSGLSNIVKINLNKNIKTIGVYPNPVLGNRVSFQTSDLAKGTYNVEVINAMGSRVFQQSVNHAGGAINQSLNLPILQSGQYTLRINGTSSSSIHKITILQ